MGKYIPQLGDVIMDNGIPMIVVTIKNHERIGDCSYDREYFICEEEYICKCGCLSCMDEMKQHGRWVFLLTCLLRGMTGSVRNRREKSVYFYSHASCEA